MQIAAARLLFFCLREMIPFLVCEFGKSTLSNLVRECFGSDFPDIFRKKQIDYIFRYLSDLGAKSVLLEFEYVDKDYLEDYSRFYVKRFNSRGHKCARLHFFSRTLDHGTVDEILLNHEAGARASLQESYLGFMVVKPLPKTFIGKTCLKHYDGINKDGSKRSLTRRYDVSLFGVCLYVDSVAFQEQDKVVSACATTAIWSALNALSWRPIRGIPSCSEITTNAINFIEGSSNSFPNKELSNKQILRALDVEGLRHHSFENSTRDELVETVKCHVDSGLPLILGVDVYGFNQEGLLTKVGGHAVCILGYKLSGSDAALYIHDDRLGPFARATFADLQGHSMATVLKQTWGLVLQEKDDKGNWMDVHEVLVPNFLISSTHQKVRLPLSLAVNTCHLIVEVYEKQIIGLAKEAGASEISSLQNQLTFQVSLAEISELKRSYLEFEPEPNALDPIGGATEASSAELTATQRDKVQFLTTSYARFQWAADFYYKGRSAFRMLIDATDIPQGHAVSAVLVKNKLEADAVLEVLRKYAESPKALHAIEAANQTFFSSFLRRLRPEAADISDHLNKTYGDLRAPRYLKESEFRDGEIRVNKSAQRFYEPIEKTLDVAFPTLGGSNGPAYLIWAIAHDGALLIGEEIEQMGHPCLTGFKPARIAGELKRVSTGWTINSKSGRYSSDYANASVLLENALRRFKSVFHASRDQIGVEIREETPNRS